MYNCTNQTLDADFFTSIQFDEESDGGNLTDAIRYKAGGWPRNDWAEKEVCVFLFFSFFFIVILNGGLLCRKMMLS
jgi:hypothetical protein